MKSFTLKHLSILCAIVFVALTMPHVFAYPLLSEHVINGGFESGWTGWSKQGPVGLDGSGPHSGSFSAILTTTTGCDMSGIWQLAIPVVANVDYEFSFWYRDDAGHHGVVRTWPDAWCTNLSLPYSASWLQNTCVFSSTISQDIRIYFDLESCDNAHFWVDDVSIIEYVPPPPPPATPIGSAFTYQGRMFDASNAPVQGTCDLALRLYDHDSGGTQIGATITITGMAMTDGYFDVAPDFGAPSFNGEARWLEIESACPPGAGSTTFPRQAITVVPYALYALNSSGITSTVYVTETVYYTPSYHLQGWETITGTPGTYTPTAHTQDWTTITGTPASYTPTAHTQGWSTITDQPSTYTPTTHTQSWNTITSQPSEYTPTLGAHTWTGLQTFNAGASAASGQFINALTDGATGGIRAGSAGDVLLYRSAADTWRTPDSLIVDGYIGIANYAPSSKVTIGTGVAGESLSLGPYTQLGGAYSSADTVLGHMVRPIPGVFGLEKSTDITIESSALIINDGFTFATKASDSNPKGTVWSESTNLKVRISNDGNFGIGTANPNSFKLQVAGNIGPDVSNTYDLGSASTYWATIHYHTLTSHSLSVFSTTVTLQNGKEVSCLNALKEIKADPTKKIKGVQHMDYATIPYIALNAAPITGFDRNTMTTVKNGEDGADLDMMVSLVLCAEKELDIRITALDNRMSDFEKRISDLEQKVQ